MFCEAGATRLPHRTNLSPASLWATGRGWGILQMKFQCKSLGRDSDRVELQRELGRRVAGDLDAARHLHDRDAADELQRLFVAGDFSGVSRYVTRLAKSDPQASLADLARHLAQDSPEDVDGGPAGNIESRAELKAMRYFRNTWSRLSVDRQVTQAIGQGPENAGPLNSHRLVLRSLALMREISPDYLNRFVSYVDTLLWLDQADRRHRPRPGKQLATKRR